MGAHCLVLLQCRGRAESAGGRGYCLRAPLIFLETSLEPWGDGDGGAWSLYMPEANELGPGRREVLHLVRSQEA